MTTNINLVHNLNNPNSLCDLSHLGLLEVSGADALTFLQGQVTNDVKLLTMTNDAHLTAYCNPKGRMLALFLAFYHHDHFHLQFNRELLVPIMKRLNMYVMRSKVKINDISDNFKIIGLDGPDAATILASSLMKIARDIELPTKEYAFVSLANAVILKLPSMANHARYEIFADNTLATEIKNLLQERCQLVEKPYWDYLEINAGIPDVQLVTQEQFVPQMLNLDILNGINFKKGCYTGQEIVARTHYLGSVKRRTYLVEISLVENLSTEHPQAGNKVLDATHNEVGQIVRVAPNSHDQFDALIEMRIDAATTGSIFWNHTAVIFKDLPYSLEN